MLISPHPRLIAIFNQLQVQAGPVGSVHIALGELLPLSQEEIRTQWLTLADGTRFAGAQVKIRLIPAEQQCMVCFEKYHPLHGEVSCPNCGSVGAKILAGEEFYLESVEGTR